MSSSFFKNINRAWRLHGTYNKLIILFTQTGFLQHSKTNTFFGFALDVLEWRREPWHRGVLKKKKKKPTHKYRPAPQRLLPILLEHKLDTIQTSYYETALTVDKEKAEKNRGEHSEGWKHTVNSVGCKQGRQEKKKKKQKQTQKSIWCLSRAKSHIPNSHFYWQI